MPSWQPSLIFFNIPIESGTIIKPCTLKHFQVTYILHKAGYWTIMNILPGYYINCSLPRQYSNQCLFILHWTLAYKPQDKPSWYAKSKSKSKISYYNKMIIIHRMTQRLKPIWIYLSHKMRKSVSRKWIKKQNANHFIQASACYRKTSNISRTLVGNKIVDNSDVVGASPVGAAPTTSSFST